MPQVLNQQKKYGGRRVGQNGVEGASVRASQPHTISYGCSKKSLEQGQRICLYCMCTDIYTHNTVHYPLILLFPRRTPGSRFVPPVRREERESEGGRGACLDAVQSRVQYGGTRSGGSGGGGGGGGVGALPPELEGDERLRNIEPRMVELIMNEVKTYPQ